MDHYPRVETLFAAAARTAAIAGSHGTAVNCAGAKRVVILLNVTAMGGASGDTLDVYADVVAPDGTTYLNAVHFPQVAGNAAAVQHYAVLDLAAAPAATTFNVTADCAVGVTKPYLFGLQVVGRYTLVDAGAHGQSATFSLTALLQ
jgi:hypothetical protein